MPIPNPEPGLVISYAYLWHHEHRAGREEDKRTGRASSFWPSSAKPTAP